MRELCQNIVKHHQVDPRIRGAFNQRGTGTSLCKEEVLARCGIDLSSFLAEKEKLKMSYKQVLDEIRGFNGSLCLKMQFGVPLARLGTPHLIRYHILMPHSKNSVQMEFFPIIDFKMLLYTLVGLKPKKLITVGRDQLIR